MGKFFEDVFLPSMKKLVQAHRSYEDVKRLVKISTTWGAKITSEQFEDRVKCVFLEMKSPTRATCDFPSNAVVQGQDPERLGTA